MPTRAEAIEAVAEAREWMRYFPAKPDELTMDAWCAGVEEWYVKMREILAAEDDAKEAT